MLIRPLNVLARSFRCIPPHYSLLITFASACLNTSLSPNSNKGPDTVPLVPDLFDQESTIGEGKDV